MSRSSGFCSRVSGHPLLQAALCKRGPPGEVLTNYAHGEPVKVTGVITYNFVL